MLNFDVRSLRRLVQNSARGVIDLAPPVAAGGEDGAASKSALPPSGDLLASVRYKRSARPASGARPGGDIASGGQDESERGGGGGSKPAAAAVGSGVPGAVGEPAAGLPPGRGRGAGALRPPADHCGTLLHVAAWCGHARIVRYLLETVKAQHGGDAVRAFVNAHDNGRNRATALNLVVRIANGMLPSRLSICRALLAEGADVAAQVSASAAASACCARACVPHSHTRATFGPCARVRAGVNA
jgi:hypothetical protein